MAEAAAAEPTRAAKAEMGVGGVEKGVLGRSQVEVDDGGPPMAVGRNGLLAAEGAEAGKASAEAGG